MSEWPFGPLTPAVNPHSHACNPTYHKHGKACANDCPTCHGIPHQRHVHLDFRHEHEWIDATTVDSHDRLLICATCDGTKREPR